MRLKIKLTEKEIEFARNLAEKREGSVKKASKSANYFRADRSGHFIGILGEIAFSKYTKLDVDVSTNEFKGDNGVDFKTEYGSIDVKTACYDPPVLKFNSLNDFSSDYAVMAMTTNYKVVWLCGWCSKSHFLKNYKTADFGYGKKYILEEGDLWNMEK